MAQNSTQFDALDAAAAPVPGLPSSTNLTALPPEPKPSNRMQKILIGALFVLMIIIIALTALTIRLLTQGEVQVTVNGNQTTSTTQDTSTTDPEDTTDADQPSTDEASSGVYIYLVQPALADAFDETKLPQGAIALFDYGSEYLIPVEVTDVAVADSNYLQAALDALFMAAAENADSGYQSMLADMGLVATITNGAGAQQIDITGEITLAGDTSSVYIKGQIENTIKHYTNNFSITLNGSESDYRCLGDLSGMCE